MFWLILRISGEIAMLWGPATLEECEAQKAVIEINRPANHEYSCMRGKVQWDAPNMRGDT